MNWAEIWNELWNGSLLAGIIGSACSLYFIKDLDNKKAVVAVLIGVAAANYLSPLVVLMYPSAASFMGSIGFVIGFTAMGVGGWVMYIFKNPERLIDAVKALRK